MALTDAQWSASLVTLVVQLLAEEITPAAAKVELTRATNDWPTRTLSNGDLARRVSQVVANLDGLIVGSGLPDPSVGGLDSHYFDDTTGDFYGPKAIDGWGGVAFSLIGPQGASAKALVIAAGELPADATDQDFALWLRNAQIVAVKAAV